MRKLALLIGMIATACLGLFAQSQKIDPKFSEVFGQTGIVIASNTVIDRNTYVPANFDYRDGKCYVKAGKGAGLSIRFILPKGKTFLSYVSALAPGGKPYALLSPYGYYTNYNFYLSNDPATGAVLAADFPKSPEEVSSIWKSGPNDFMRYKINEDGNDQTSSRVDLNNLYRSSAVRAFMAKAKPGWWIYVTINFGMNTYDKFEVVTKATGLKVPACTGIIVVK
jgi:hypothetical protein